jgi:DNA-binding MarR family transcriptional regulator
VADGHELAMGLRIAYLALHRCTGAELARVGLTADQFVLLTTLVDGETVSQKELVRRNGSDANTISEMLARLERRGLIARQRHATDGRARSVTLTEEGRRVQREAWHVTEPLRERLQGLFRSGVLDTLVENLGRVARAIDPLQDRPPRNVTRGRTAPRPPHHPTPEIDES